MKQNARRFDRAFLLIVFDAAGTYMRGGRA